MIRELLGPTERDGRLIRGPFDRQAKCNWVRRVSHDEDVVLKRHESGAWTLHGTVQCGGWNCPSCGQRRARETSAKLGVAFKRHLKKRGEGSDLWMATFAPPHSFDDNATEVVAKLYDAYARFLQSRAWRRFTERWGIVGRVRVLDATHGGKNGTHPHFHVALFVTSAWVSARSLSVGRDLEDWQIASLNIAAKPTEREEFLDEQRNGLMPAWEACCIAAGIRIADPTAFREFSLKLSGSEKASGYFTKWGLADEIGAPTAKSRSHLRLLDAVHARVRGAARAFLAWRWASDGKAWVTGLQDICDRYAVTDDDVQAYLVELREEREAELARKGTPIVKVAPLSLSIGTHLYRGALAVGWEAVFAMVDAASAAGEDEQLALEKFLWTSRVEARARGPDPPEVA